MCSFVGTPHAESGYIWKIKDKNCIFVLIVLYLANMPIKIVKINYTFSDTMKIVIIFLEFSDLCMIL